MSDDNHRIEANRSSGPDVERVARAIRDAVHPMPFWYDQEGWLRVGEIAIASIGSEREAIVGWLLKYPPVIGLSEMAAWNTAAAIARGDHASAGEG